MKFITHTEKNGTSAYDSIFAQGASVIARDGDLSAGLWFDHTPIHQGHPIGTIGECLIDSSPASVEFLSHCADYLHQYHHCSTVVGPMNGNTWLRHRLVLESSGRPPFLMEPQEPEHFKTTFEAAGFSILSQYSSSLIQLTPDQPTFPSLEKRLEQRGVTIRSIRPERFEEDLTAIFRLSLISFSNNFLYTPLDQASFVGKYRSAQEHIDPELILLAERDGKLVGYVFCIPDLEAHKYQQAPAVIVKTLAALPDRTLSGLGTVLVARAQQKAKSKGYSEAIHALQYESNSSLRISQRFSAEVFRRYALMTKNFTPA
ncbi:GNAT family N-acetyltransferase [Verrucomicrobiaceae bacterium N1E253]|uniref:GNAT family N-acetyltransferase n=1 Tax=Oceaniferula marina TaxID=2748318 RepID=A0A851G8W5_9BACT|nr:GNAT family N-acetyltransferase [Oceaniferula marina]NWK54158.1 GNAT family N-acetyltransferase [Oceaniferula marina]